MFVVGWFVGGVSLFEFLGFVMGVFVSFEIVIVWCFSEFVGVLRLIRVYVVVFFGF